MRRVAVIVFLGLGSYASAGEKGDCICLYKGGAVKEGETACIATAQGPELARCGKFLNNTSWIPLHQPCRLPQSSKLEWSKVQVSAR